ncbi:MAG: response regulator [Proteobacteria bacterium]|nr:response regulator [Pseudomonadota bacterium]
MTSHDKPRVLCVDDEPNVLDGLRRQLRRGFALTTAIGAPEGLAIMEREQPFSVVVSDLRMPRMDGIEFLRRVRTLQPDTVRILLTGNADLKAAIGAVNQGAIFRFLSKPCPSDLLTQAVKAACEQYRLVTAERVLLEQTLRGSVDALTEVLSLASPEAFGRASRLKQWATTLCKHLSLGDTWFIEVAAMLSQIGSVVLPPDTASKLYHGAELSDAEEAMVKRMPAVAERLLGSIPRLEPVGEILAAQHARFDGAGGGGPRGESIPLGARLLKVVSDMDTLEARGLDVATAFQMLDGREGHYDPKLLALLKELRGHKGQRPAIQELPLSQVRPDMIFVEDVRAKTGVLLVARGQRATPELLERLYNFVPRIGVREPIRCREPRNSTPVAAA